MKAKMNIMRRAMTNPGMIIDNAPIQRKPRVEPTNGMQKGIFAGTAKKKN
jgi:hypothetical protein